MNILFISIAWPKAGERNLYSDLMDEFISKGHRVHVVGTQDKGRESKQELSQENGITVLRVNSGQIRKTSYLRKAVLLLTLGRKIRTAVMEQFGREHYDLIIGPTPSITLSNLYKNLKRY